MLLASPALADDCRYYAPDGRSASIEDGYLVIHVGQDDRFCETDYAELDGVADCPTDEGDTQEFEFSVDDAGLHFQDQIWIKRCETGV